MGFIGSKIDVKRISEQTIKPAKPTPTHLRYLKTSLFDHVNTPVFMPLILFYAPPTHTSLVATTTSTTTKSFLDRLRISLATTLSVFYPLAGRVKDDINYIDCNDEGVPYIEAQVSGACFENFINKADVTQLDKLLPYHCRDGLTRLLLAIQVNAFPCGGIAIAIKASHALTDAFSKFMFMKTWALITNSDHDDYNKILGNPYFQVSNFFPPPLTPKLDAPIRVFGPDPYYISIRPVSKWFRFTKAKLDHLRSNIISKSKNKDEKIPSLFLVLSGFILSRIKLICKDDNTHNLPIEVLAAVSIRPKVSPPSESSYFYGNMAINATAKLSMIGNNTESLCLEFIDELKKAIGDILSDKMLMKNAQQGKVDLSFMNGPFERAAKGEVMCFGFSNVRNFPVYEADFGWGKPVWVTFGTLLGAGLNLFLPAAPPSQDIIAFLNLTAQQMSKLTRDPEFLSILSNDQASCKL